MDVIIIIGVGIISVGLIISQLDKSFKSNACSKCTHAGKNCNYKR